MKTESDTKLFLWECERSEAETETEAPVPPYFSWLFWSYYYYSAVAHDALARPRNTADTTTSLSYSRLSCKKGIRDTASDFCQK